jgi:hypothetical protein
VKFAFASLVLSLAAVSPAAAQMTPFDMSPERSEEPALPNAAPPVQPPAVQPPAAPPPAVVVPEASQPQAPAAGGPEPEAPAVLAPSPDSQPGRPAQAVDDGSQSPPAEEPDLSIAPSAPPAVPAAETPAAETPAVASADADASRRYLLPSSDFVLAGEYARRAWSIYLTPEQAAAKTTLRLGYQNAIVIAPEISRLDVSINGTRLLDVPIASSDGKAGLAAEIPAGLLNAGMNDITIEARQRHRTDCTIESTYELWTQIEPAETYLEFAGAGAGRWQRVEDIRAIGVDEASATRFNLVVPSAGQVTSTAIVVRFAQTLGLMANMPNQSFSISEGAVPPPGAGEANVVVGIASELAGVLATLPAGSQSGPTVSLVDDPTLGPSTLVATGPTWRDVEAAVDTLAQQVDRPLGVQRTLLASRPWRTPDVPMIFNAAQLRLSEVGLSTLEFSGRRVRTDFAVGAPADFYANAYGEATLLLDAAYSQEVLPGSHIDVYVNDNIAATVPITTAGGEILRHLPIKVTMRHFRPGENVIAIEAVLLTEADKLCAPGATGLDNNRFVIFDSSEFVMPDFARIGRTPELSGLGGTGFPYSRADYPIPLVLDRTQLDTLSAATTLLARMSLAAGRLIAVDASTSVASIADRHALFVNAISQVPPTVLAQVGVSDQSRSSWGETVATVRTNTESTFDQWQERLQGSGWRGRITRFEEWLTRTFNVSNETFRIFRSDAPPFIPGSGADLMVASNFNPTGTGNWTLVSAPTVAGLKAGMNELTSRMKWQQMGGHITTLDAATEGVSRIAPNTFAFFETLPPSFENYRLVAANWLSANALSYGLAVSIMAVALGLATAGLLGALGRRQ